MTVSDAGNEAAGPELLDIPPLIACRRAMALAPTPAAKLDALKRGVAGVSIAVRHRLIDRQTVIDAVFEQAGSVGLLDAVGDTVIGHAIADALETGIDEHCDDDGGAQKSLFPPLPPSEPYPVAAMGSLLGDAAEAIARKIQVPAAIAAQSVLAAAGLVAQAHADVLLPFGQTRPLSLFFVTIAASGDRKSSADREALWPIRKHEAALKSTYDREMRDWKIMHAAWAAEKRKVENNRALDINERRRQLEALGDEPPHPLYPFLTAPDPTIEGLIKAWPNAKAALGIFAAEGGQFIGGYGMRQDHLLKTAAGLSDLWDGLPIKRVRALDGVSVLHGRRLCMHLMIQPDAAAKFLADPVLRDQGFLSRTLVASPESIAGTRFFQEPNATDDSAIRAYGARLLSIAETDWPLADGRNELAPRKLKLSGEASRQWCDFFDQVEIDLGPDRKYRPIGDLGAKIAEHAARVAGVLAIVRDVGASEIAQSTMSDAITLARWYLTEAVRLQQAARTDPKILVADAVLKFLRSRPRGAETQLRELMQYGPAAVRTKTAASDAIDTLIGYGLVAEVSKRPHTIRLCEK